MQNLPEIENLIKLISKLPGLGPKSAKRIILKMINNRQEILRPLANNLSQVIKNIERCKICGTLKPNTINCEYNNCSLVEKKMKESQENLKKIEVIGVSGGDVVKITLNGDGEMTKILLSDKVLKEDKEIIQDLITAAHNDAKNKLKSKTSEEISKATGGLGVPGFKWPL